MIETDKADDPEVGARTSVSPGVPPPAIPPLRLQPDAEQTDAGHYRLDELLRYHDRAFIHHVYAALAKRAPTQTELTNTLDDLRSGRRGKIEIIECLLAAQTGGHPTVHVDGLPSPVLHRLSRWPVIGYMLRIVKDVARIPLLIQHQQQFEAYALGQQQRIADYVNQVGALAVDQPGDAAPKAQFASTVGDAAETAMMLSDALVELSGRHEELQAQVQDLQIRLQDFQTQREQSEAQLHSALVAVTEAVTEQQRRLDESQRAQGKEAGGQREFLVQEQRAIVEAQKVAFSELQEQLRALAREHEDKRAELTAEVRDLHALIEGFRADLASGAGKQKRKQV